MVATPRAESNQTVPHSLHPSSLAIHQSKQETQNPKRETPRHFLRIFWGPGAQTEYESHAKSHKINSHKWSISFTN